MSFSKSVLWLRNRKLRALRELCSRQGLQPSENNKIEEVYHHTLLLLILLHKVSPSTRSKLMKKILSCKEFKLKGKYEVLNTLLQSKKPHAWKGLKVNLRVLLFSILLDETSDKKDKEYWTPEYSEVSKQLVDTFSLEKIPEIKETEAVKSLKVRVYPSVEDKKLLEGYFHTANYVYNKTVSLINSGEKVNFFDFIDRLVTLKSKRKNPEFVSKSNNTNIKAVRNTDISDWELLTPKDVRSYAVQDAVTAYKTGISNLKAGNIKFFCLKHREKKRGVRSITFQKGNFKMVGKSIKVGGILLNYKYKKPFEISQDSKLIKKYGKYYLIIPQTVRVSPTPLSKNSFIGVDPGVRTFMTTYGSNGVVEYYKEDSKTRREIKKVNKKLDILKGLKGIRKSSFTKLNYRKENLVNHLHYDTITQLLKSDNVFYGDIKSHSIVKGGRNSKLNRDISDLKLYQFKEKLLHKAALKAKSVVLVNEAYTTKTCSGCGWMYYGIGSSKTFECKGCNLIIDRDVNSAKNILMKGILSK